MTSTLIKTTIGITAGTVAVGGGATVAYLNSGNSKEVKKNDAPIQIETPTETQKKTITKLLSEKGLAILGNDVAGGNANGEKFKTDYEKIEPKAYWSFSDWEAVKIKPNGSEDLKTRCATNITKEALDDTSPLYLSVKKYCTNAKD